MQTPPLEDAVSAHQGPGLLSYLRDSLPTGVVAPQVKKTLPRRPRAPSWYSLRRRKGHRRGRVLQFEPLAQCARISRCLPWYVRVYPASPRASGCSLNIYIYTDAVPSTHACIKAQFQEQTWLEFGNRAVRVQHVLKFKLALPAGVKSAQIEVDKTSDGLSLQLGSGCGNSLVVTPAEEMFGALTRLRKSSGRCALLCK